MQEIPFPPKPVIAIISVAAFFLGVSLAYIGTTFFGNSTENLIPTPVSTISFSKATPAPINNNNKETGVYNALLLGYGGGNHDGALLTDSMVVIRVNTNTHKATLISIPRDLWVPGNQKINAAGITGFQNSKPVVQEVTGLAINYYVSIDFTRFVSLIDNLGGLTVTVPQTFDDPFYPIIGQENNTCGFSNDQINAFKAKYNGFDLERQFTCRYEHIHFDGGTKVNLDGATALKFVRSRHGDSDFGRSLRQFAVLEGISSKLITLRSMNKIDATISSLFSMVQTDLDLGTIKSLMQVFGDTGLYKINHIQLTSDNVLNNGTSSDGQFILTPKSGNFDYQSIKDYINQNL